MRIFLAPFALIYTFIHRLRRRLFQIGLLRAQRLSKPVISVGNLTAGGTGKTPFIDVLLTQLEEQNLKACVLTRGYGRKTSEIKIVNEQSSVEEVGDEPLWLYRRHPKSLIAVGADRKEAAKAAEKMAGESHSKIDLFLLDDGLQHLNLHRDLEITLIDATQPLWHFRPLPWGYGRDSWSVLRRSDIIVLTRSNQASLEQLDKIAAKVFDHGALDVIESFVKIDKGLNVTNGLEIELRGPQKAGLISAIGNPQSFENLLKENGFEIAFHDKKRDHWNYTLSDIQNVEEKSQKLGLQMIATTEKDSVKIQKYLEGRKGEIPWVAVKIKMTFDPELPNIYELVSHSSH